MKRVSWILVAPALLAGCDGCKKTERASPLRYVDAGAQIVVEIRDIGAARELPGYVEKHLGTVITKAQIASLVEEVRLTIGFDPTTAEGLKNAGLAQKGPIAASLAADGSGALWLVPVEDPKRLAPLLEKQLKARAGDKIAKSKAGDVELTTLSSEFGQDLVERAAYAFDQGYLFLAFGRGAGERITQALAMKPADSIIETPTYRGLAAALGDDHHVRVLAPGGGEALSSLAAVAQRFIPNAPQIGVPFEKQVASAGWSFRLDADAVRVKGRVRMDGEGVAAVRKVMTPRGPVGPGVVSLDLPGAVAYVQAAGDPEALAAALAPGGSPARGRLDAVFGRIESDVGVDVEKDILPKLSGHGAMAVGVGKLEGKPFKEIVGNPRGVLWTAFALGSDEPKVLADAEKKLDEGLEARGVVASQRKFNNIDVRSLAPAAGGAALVETFVLPKAWVFSNEPLISDRIVLNGGGQDRLNGKGGLIVELRMKTLASELAKFDAKSLPLLWRGMVAKGLDLVRLFERAELKVAPAPDGVQMDGALVFSK